MVMIDRIKNPMTNDREHSDQMTAKHNDAKQMTNDYFYSNRLASSVLSARQAERAKRTAKTNNRNKKTINGIAY